jgi:hypothetical protein
MSTRQPRPPLFRILDGRTEMMRFHAKDDRGAMSVARKNTAVLNTGARYELQRYRDAHWVAVSDIGGDA